MRPRIPEAVLPKYSSEEAANKKAKELGFDNWVSCSNRYSWALNPSCR
jgi:hypothetical protein